VTLEAWSAHAIPAISDIYHCRTREDRAFSQERVWLEDV
jgi:hypothetical protein